MEWRLQFSYHELAQKYKTKTKPRQRRSTKLKKNNNK